MMRKCWLSSPNKPADELVQLNVAMFVPCCTTNVLFDDKTAFFVRLSNDWHTLKSLIDDAAAFILC